MISGSASFSCSHDGPGSSSSLTQKKQFAQYFFFCIGVTDTGMGWFSGLATVPAAGIGAAAASAMGAGAATVPVSLFSPSSLESTE